jgi:hypothetical protein
MTKRTHPTNVLPRFPIPTWENRIRKILETMQRMARQGWSPVNLVDVAACIAEEWVYFRGAPKACKISPLVDYLCRFGLVRKVRLEQYHRYEILPELVNVAIEDLLRRLPL